MSFSSFCFCMLLHIFKQSETIQASHVMSTPFNKGLDDLLFSIVCNISLSLLLPAYNILFCQASSSVSRGDTLRLPWWAPTGLLVSVDHTQATLLWLISGTNNTEVWLDLGTESMWLHSRIDWWWLVSHGTQTQVSGLKSCVTVLVGPGLMAKGTICVYSRITVMMIKTSKYFDMGQTLRELLILEAMANLLTQ